MKLVAATAATAEPDTIPLERLTTEDDERDEERRGDEDGDGDGWEKTLGNEGRARMFEAARDLAEEIRGRIKEATKLTASVGVGPNFMLAKVRASLARTTWTERHPLA